MTRGLSSRARNSRRCSSRSDSDIMTGSVASSCSTPSMARRERDSARIHASISSGMRISRSVWPVGAVSKTIRSKRSSSPRISAPMRSNSAISSAPGMLAARSICRFASLRMCVAEQALDVFLDVGDVALRLERAVDLEAVQVRQQLHRLRADRPLEDVGGRVRRIGRDQQHALAGAARRQRHRRRARGLADAALAAEEQDALVDAARAAVDRRRQQQGRLPSGERSMPMRRCHRWN